MLVRSASRWLVIAVVVIGALIVAIWPRLTSTGTGPLEVGVTSGAATDSFVDAPEAGLAGAERLKPCPTPTASSPAEAPLRGASVRCLGSAASVDLAAALSGKPTLINLWASWCGPCREEIPALDAYANEPDSVRVVGINVQDDPVAALGLLTGLGVGYASFVDTGDVRRALSVPAVLPLSFLVQPDGSVERITTPAVFGNSAQVRAAVSEVTR